VSGPESVPPQGVPTLTEVLVWPAAAASAAAAPQVPFPATEAGVGVALTEQPPGGLPTEEQLVQRVLLDLQRQVDLMLEYRLREALTPLLARAADSIIRDARGELASTLREVVARAVAQELARHRTR